jgi:hypothetical protein
MLKNIGKKNIVITVVLVLIVIIIGCWQYRVNHSNDYSVAYLITGEVYVGKLTTFPSLELKDAYILQVTKDATDSTKTNFQLNPINEALWAPKELHLTEKNVVFYGPLLPTSKIAETIAAQKK